MGLLVGGLTLGSAAPHLLSWLGGANWQLTTWLASALALLSAVLVMQTRLGPFHAVQARINPRVITVAWTDIRLRRAFLGYLGHMWELYALWAWVAPAAAASYAMRMSPEQSVEWSKLTAFLAIGAGALLCPFAGGSAGLARSVLSVGHRASRRYRFNVDVDAASRSRILIAAVRLPLHPSP